MPTPIHGIFVPNMVPLHSDGRINEPELRRYIDWLIERGVHGLYPNGSSGEFLRFTADERRAIIRICCEQAAGRVPVLAGAAEANAAETIKACETYAGYGARAVAIVSPFYYKLSPESVYAYFREIALHTPIDVTLYNIPMFASPIDVPTIRRLIELPRIAAIKDSSGDIAYIGRVLAAVKPVRPDFAVLTGWDAALLPMLVMGCDGGTNATAGVVPQFTRQLYDLTVAGQLDQARPLQLRLIELFDAIVYAADFPEGLRAAVECRGFTMGPSRQPMTDRQRIDRTALQRVIQCIIADFGYSERPEEGCPPRSGNVEEDRVRQLTAGVIGELKRRGVVH
jgi:4-hydroxy-tetrahydrodipicolinate synthase